MQKENLWQSVLAQMQLEISNASFNTWFKNTNISDIRENQVVISVPNTFVRDWLHNKYRKEILKIIRKINPQIKNLDYTVNPAIKTEEKFQKKGKEKNEESNINQMSFQELVVDYKTGLNPKYTFQNFVIGPFNELAHAASFAVSQNPGSLYNPLFIYSKTGLGKTHLLQAVGNKIQNELEGKNVLYIQAQKFISDIISSIRNNKMDDFKNRYKDIDVLIIDDIQFLSGKEKTQEEFFHTFNELYEKNKQIILSSDRPPNAINSLASRLRSRFEGGMITDIDYPDTETRAAILKIKASERKLSIPDDVCYYIAENVQRSIRELEGVLNKLIIQKQTKNNPINLEETKKLLKNINQSSVNSFSFNKILKAVANFYEVSEKDIISPSRKREVVKSRQMVIYLLRQELNYSYPYIGKKIGGKDHTTIIHSFSKIKKDMQKNKEIEEELSYIRESLISV